VSCISVIRLSSYLRGQS